MIFLRKMFFQLKQKNIVLPNVVIYTDGSMIDDISGWNVMDKLIKKYRKTPVHPAHNVYILTGGISLNIAHRHPSIKVAQW